MAERYEELLQEMQSGDTVTRGYHQQIHWYPGHMVKARRGMEEDLALVDMLVEVVDARAPFSSRNPDLAQYAKRKPHLLLLNKADLADPQQTKQWIARYKKEGYIPVAVNAARKEGLKDLQAALLKAGQPFREKLARKGLQPRDPRAMIIGVPNCGKSTVINALSPKSSAKTGNKPGVTRGRQWVKTGAGVELLDTPGLLWPRFANYHTAFCLAVIGCISDAAFPMYQVAGDLALWLKDNAPQALMERYKLKELPDTADEIFTAIGRSRGLLGPGGTVRYEDAAPILLQEYRAGKLGRLSLEKATDVFAEDANEQKQ